jgi:AcrR family transcriptional regulator
MATTAPRSRKRPRRTQQERVEESSKRLLIAASELIAKQGFERTTAAEIGERAGYSRNMVRDRYGSKEALVEALLREEFEPRVNPSPPDGLTGLERVFDQVDHLAALAREEETLVRSFFVLTFETAGPIPSLRPWYRSWMESYQAQMKDSLRAGVADGSIRPGLEEDMEVELFTSHALGLAFRWTLDWDGFDYAGEVAAWRAWLERRYSPGFP